MDDNATLCDLAKVELERLESLGVKVTPEDIVWLNYLCWKVRTPEARRLLSRGRPIPVGGTWLWPLTMAAFEWLRVNNVKLDRPSEWIGYAMAYARSDGHELDVEGKRAIASVKEWASNLKCTRQELFEAIAQVDSQESVPETPPDSSGSPMSLAQMSSLLSTNCGGSPEFWERRCSLGYAVSSLTTYIVQNHADKTPSMYDPRIVAERALGYAIEKIIAKAKKESAHVQEG